ncbi:MAG: UPF0179 family protein [Candidatus Methanomethylophilaceae archaeon]|nr:UPF0179 family protein [Candidatus Methanomethylophilaceae archaeon]MDY0225052.1 UPF0179 family protein [Candidatus Methanomethylophilaceae archaeon]
MVLITLIGEPLAEVGKKFYYMGPQTECKECRLRAVCFNLEQGSMYEITKIRDQIHDCIATEDLVHVVEVQKISTSAAVPKKFAIDGSVITFQAPKCEQLGCKNYQNCHPVGIEDGRKSSVVEIIGDAECPIGEKMVLVKII